MFVPINRVLPDSTLGPGPAFIARETTLNQTVQSTTTAFDT